MTCYKDRIFCPFTECRHAKICDRALTEKIIAKDEREGLPIDRYTERQPCFDYCRHWSPNFDGCFMDGSPCRGFNPDGTKMECYE